MSTAQGVALAAGVAALVWEVTQQRPMHSGVFVEQGRRVHHVVHEPDPRFYRIAGQPMAMPVSDVIAIQHDAQRQRSQAVVDAFADKRNVVRFFQAGRERNPYPLLAETTPVHMQQKMIDAVATQYDRTHLAGFTGFTLPARNNVFHQAVTRSGFNF